ncbi:MAG: redoxin domain-containing protein, partial [SAR202 cluster bacterium]|nr:redoxin domain-containing protein [SAR202 cluster bacterium]
MRFLQTLLPQFEGADTQVLGSSTDAVAPQKAFADHCGVKFPLVSDHPAFQGAKAFGVYQEDRMSNTRMAFVIDKAGVIRHVIDGSDMERYGR